MFDSCWGLINNLLYLKNKKNGKSPFKSYKVLLNLPLVLYSGIINLLENMVDAGVHYNN